MSDLYGRITNEQDLLTRLVSKIPGFRGYVERETRRSADKMIREVIASRFEEQWQHISRLQRDLIGARQIDLVDDLEAAAIKLRQFADRIRHAAYGYAGFFDAIKIQEEELSRIYQFDLQLLEKVDEISNAVGNVESSIGTDGLPAAIRHLTTVAQETIETYNRRMEVIQAME
ncbi:MAG TPA: hypothetical protein VFF68_05685 [Anaerolineaceae bacterium]|nr:hypothetical protein [Anaerolineaceae bacterium]